MSAPRRSPPGVNDFLDKSAPSEILRLRITAALRAKRLADLAARRFEEQAYLARVAEDLANSLAEDALLATAARARSVGSRCRRYTSWSSPSRTVRNS
jgi:hypothetical protein